MRIIVLAVTAVFLMINTFTMAQDGKERVVVIHTDYGDITAKLYNDTPKHRDNFIKLVKEGWYENSPFHRVIKGFMIQGGSSASGEGDPGYTIEAEILPHHFHKKGALAAARMGDQVNPEKRSSGSQFYIVQGTTMNNEVLNSHSQRFNKNFSGEQREAYTTMGGSPHLDGEYTVFGEVISGFEVIDKIANVRTGQMDKPIEPVTMTIEILE